MRLLIAEAPQRRLFRIVSDSGIFRHDGGWIGRCNEKKIERQDLFWSRLKLANRSREVESSKRLMNKHRPAGSSDDPRYRNSSAMRPKLVPALPTFHRVDGSATIELLSPFTQTQKRCISALKRKLTRVCVPVQLLNGNALFVCDSDVDGIKGDLQLATARRNVLGRGRVQFDRRSPGFPNERSIRRNHGCLAVVHGQNAQSEGMRADGCQVHFDRRSHTGVAPCSPRMCGNDSSGSGGC